MRLYWKALLLRLYKYSLYCSFCLLQRHCLHMDSSISGSIQSSFLKALLIATHFTTRFTCYRVLTLLRALLATEYSIYYVLYLLQRRHFTTHFTCYRLLTLLHSLLYLLQRRHFMCAFKLNPQVYAALVFFP